MFVPDIEITIPVLNEEKTLKNQILKIIEFLDKDCGHYGQIGLVISDNGSNDKTSHIAREFQENDPRIRYLRLEEKGVGRALKASWLSSKAGIIGYMDLDLSTDIEHLHQVFDALLSDKYDMVAGTRLAKESVVTGRSIIRNFTSRIFNEIISLSFRGNFTDGMCGFKFLKRDILEVLIENGADNNGWFFSTELLVVADYKKFRILDLPIRWTDDPNSKVKIIKLSIEYLKAIFNLKKRLKQNEV